MAAQHAREVRGGSGCLSGRVATAVPRDSGSRQRPGTGSSRWPKGCRRIRGWRQPCHGGQRRWRRRSPAQGPSPHPRFGRRCAGTDVLSHGADIGGRAGRVVQRDVRCGATVRYPAMVLGAAAPPRLGIDAANGTRVWLGGGWFTVIGIPQPVPLAPNWTAPRLPAGRRPPGSFTSTATRARSTPGPPTTRSPPSRLSPGTANPHQPNEIDVARPSDALSAKQAAEATLTALCCLG